MKNLLFACFALFAFFQFNHFSLAAQNLNPVKWSYTIEATEKSDTTHLLKITATIEEGWYIYSQNLDEGGPIPTSFEFEENRDVVFLSEEITEIGEAKTGFDKLFEMEITKYAEQLIFEAPLKITGSAATITGSLQFMACDKSRCLPPATVDFSVEIE